MLEDVLGWVVVLIGAIVMKFTDIKIIDPILSIGVAIFIFKNAISNLQEVLDLFLEKTPKEINVEELKHHLLEIEEHMYILDDVQKPNVFRNMFPYSEIPKIPFIL